jgi:hypothetical protein
MNNIKKFIIFLIITILSIIFSILSYYGLIRYFSIYFTSLEKYANIYKSSSDITIDNIKKIVVTFTLSKEQIISLNTSNYELVKLENTIKSLLDQTKKIDMIVINIPKNDIINKSIHKRLSNFVSIFYINKNLTYGNSLIPTLKRESENNTVIISIPSTYIIYGKDFIETIVDNFVNNKKSIRCNSNILLVTPSMFNDSILNIENTNINWIDNYINNYYDINYSENYKIL